MPSLSLNISAVLVACSIAAVGAASARGDVVAGPVLNLSDVSWQFSGIGFTANVNSYLTAFTFQNQGLADTVELVDTSGNVLDSVTTPASDSSDALSVTWQLTAGGQYFLLQTADSNSRFADYGTTPPSDTQITMTDAGIFSSSPVSSAFNIRGSYEWAAFNNITTVSSATSAVPEPRRLGFLALCLVGAAIVRRKRLTA
jgi:hypothetical protein